MGDVVELFPSPLRSLAAEAPDGPQVWRHDVMSPEFKTLSAPARALYLALLFASDYQSQEVDAGLSRLGELSGLLRNNVPRYVRELEAAGLVSVTKCNRGRKADGSPRVHYRSRYVLLTVPSALRPKGSDPRQQTFKFRRLAPTEGAQLRQEARKRRQG